MIFEGRRRLALVTMVFAAGCGDLVGDEARAREATEVAGSALMVLTSVAELTTGASAAQDSSGQVQQPSDVNGPCATVSLPPGAVVVDYGVGCPAGPNVLSGAYVLRLRTIPVLGVQLEFQGFRVNNLGLEGFVSAGVGNGRITAGMDLTLSEGDQTHRLAFDGSLWTEPTTLLMDGAGRYEREGSVWAIDGTDIRLRLGECYPRGGILALSGPREPPMFIGFRPDTPETGLVEVRVNLETYETALPAYGACPPAASQP